MVTNFWDVIIFLILIGSGFEYFRGRWYFAAWLAHRERMLDKEIALADKTIEAAERQIALYELRSDVSQTRSIEVSHEQV